MPLLPLMHIAKRKIEVIINIKSDVVHKHNIAFYIQRKDIYSVFYNVIPVLKNAISRRSSLLTL